MMVGLFWNDKQLELIRRFCDVAWQIRLDLRYTGQLQLPVKVEAIAMPEQSADLLVKQQGDGVLVPTQLSQQNELENASISSCIQVCAWLYPKAKVVACGIITTS